MALGHVTVNVVPRADRGSERADSQDHADVRVAVVGSQTALRAPRVERDDQNAGRGALPFEAPR